MTDTIQLLETIGGDASLRHASGDDLARTLSGMDASEALKQAAAAGDRAYLAQEPGFERLATPNRAENVSQTVPDDDDDDDDGDDGEPGESRDA